MYEATNALRDKLQQALLGFQQNGLTVDIRNGKVYVSLTDKLLFPSGSIVIDDRGKMALQQLAAVLNKEPDINIAVEGHTDNKKVINLGQIKDNWDLRRFTFHLRMPLPYRSGKSGCIPPDRYRQKRIPAC